VLAIAQVKGSAMRKRPMSGHYKFDADIGHINSEDEETDG
jgi:hypothetical protein